MLSRENTYVSKFREIFRGSKVLGLSAEYGASDKSSGFCAKKEKKKEKIQNEH
jgi:hypothetical protein